jgi:hypothetical protein
MRVTSLVALVGRNTVALGVGTDLSKMEGLERLEGASPIPVPGEEVLPFSSTAIQNPSNPSNPSTIRNRF